jgi:hypothetical protein
MAVWQYSVTLLPRQKVVEVVGTVPEILENRCSAPSNGGIRSNHHRIMSSSSGPF